MEMAHAVTGLLWMINKWCTTPLGVPLSHQIHGSQHCSPKWFPMNGKKLGKLFLLKNKVNKADYVNMKNKTSPDPLLFHVFTSFCENTIRLFLSGARILYFSFQRKLPDGSTNQICSAVQFSQVMGTRTFLYWHISLCSKSIFLFLFLFFWYGSELRGRNTIFCITSPAKWSK